MQTMCGHIAMTMSMWCSMSSIVSLKSRWMPVISSLSCTTSSAFATGGRLVEKQELRLKRYGARDFKAALEAVAASPRPGWRGRRARRAQALHAFLARRRLLALPASDVRDGLEEIIFVVLLRGGHDVLEHRRGREKAQVLEGGARCRARGLGASRCFPFEDDVAALTS